MIKNLIRSVISRLGYKISKDHGSNMWEWDEEPAKSDPDLESSEEIIRFFSKVDMFYEGIELPEALHIGGAWKGDLISRRKHQMNIYHSKDIKAVSNLHENMFYNELVAGMWLYHYYDGTMPLSAKMNFAGDFVDYISTYPNDPYLKSKIPIKSWGLRNRSQPELGILKMPDFCHAMECNLVLESLELSSKDSINVLEIGSGFGGLAERLFSSEKIKSLYLTDLPLNLVTAFYYLRRCFPKNEVILISSLDELLQLNSGNSTLPDKRIVLAPTCFFEEFANSNEVDLMCNFGSFSEMDYQTINFYMSHLPESLKIICLSNSNRPVLNTSNHTEVCSDNFPYPSNFKQVFSSIAMPIRGQSGRVKSSVHINSTLI